MIISFGCDELLEACESLEHAERKYGRIAAEALVTLLSDTTDLDRADELIALFDNDIKISPDDSLSIAIGSDYRAALVVAGKRFDRDADGRVVWASVTRLKLTNISRHP